MKHYFDIIRTMKLPAAADRLAALGNESRLAVFRLLVQKGAEGMVAGAIGARLEMPAATLSFHLSYLARAGLIGSRRESRFIRYSADFAAMDDLLAFLTDHCCQGEACLPKTAATGAAAKRRSRSQKPLSVKKRS